MIAIVIPAYNAADTISSLLWRLSQYVDKNAMIVVDDGSRDNTAELAKKYSTTLLQHDRNKGKGAALRTAFEHCRVNKSIEAVITMDADLQHRPEELPQFFEAWRNLRTDIIIGSRRRENSSMPFHRKVSNSITSYLVSVRTRQRIPDSQSGYRLLSKRVIDSVRFESDGYEAETEILIDAASMGFTIGSVPIETIYNEARSSMTYWHTTKSFLKVLLKEY
ncbi:MAG: glycosyltransferase family 2 protein [bacterium]